MNCFKGLALTAAVVMTFSALIACSGGNSAVNSQNGKNAAAPSSTGTDNGKAASTNNSSTAKKAKEIIVSKEITDADIFSSKVQLEEKVITLPVKFSDLSDMDVKIMSKDVSEDFIMDPNAQKPISIMINKNSTIDVRVVNTSKTRSPLKNCTIFRIDKTTQPNIIYPKGIRVGSKLDELTAAWGEPTQDLSKGSSKELSYEYMEYPFDTKILSAVFGALSKKESVTGRRYLVTMDRNTSKITNITCCYVAKGSKDAFETLTKELNGTEPFKLTYQIPSDLAANMVVKGSQCMGIREIEGKKYIIQIDCSIFSFGNINKEKPDEKTLRDHIEKGFGMEVHECKMEGVKVDQTSACACGYYYEDTNALMCKTYNITTEHTFSTSKSFIVPYEKDGTLSDAAVKEFKQIMNTYAQSIKQEN